MVVDWIVEQVRQSLGPTRFKLILSNQGTLIKESAKHFVKLCSMKYPGDGPFDPMEMSVFSYENRNGGPLPKHMNSSTSLHELDSVRISNETIDLKEVVKLKVASVVGAPVTSWVLVATARLH